MTPARSARASAAGASRAGSGRSAARAADLCRRIASWFTHAARPLPWRVTPRDPYLSLLSEFMLQQTQVARVLQKWPAFVARFPTLRDLAEADEQDVLAAWSGLGYYRRARLLHGASREIFSRYAARVPCGLADLRSLPGVGRYTAGAIASIVYSRPAPIVDGNVRRVLLRVEGRDLSPASADRWAWVRADELAQIAHARADVGAFNEGLMELGATICTPRAPRCAECPLRSMCRARSSGRINRIPRPARRVPVQTIHVTSLVMTKADQVLLCRRPPTGLWADLWQPPSLELDGRFARESEIAARARELAPGAPPPRLLRAGTFDHQTTHRRVRFEVWHASAPASARAPRGMRYVASGERSAFGLSNAHARALALAARASAVQGTPSAAHTQTPKARRHR